MLLPLSQLDRTGMIQYSVNITKRVRCEGQEYLSVVNKVGTL